ncbi:glycoside hydrolase family 25 protein [Ancylobacter amanitiformis]|uniref:Lysozyme n=1 Tax=Ancylobacter amanitiformis TaxID=217069 RepID=A0ABU0LXS0_9HYPH|nr:GH25 family lysozyme [Ancylobacter amanitiformis]MDQ0513517.1 lysozyme [Ancylobacter amanitiformis]
MLKALVSVVALCSVWLVSALAQEKPEIPSLASLDLIDLTDEPSRQDLFEIVRKDAMQGLTQDQIRKFDLTAPFVFPEHTRRDVKLNKPRINSIFGIDISHHNGPDVDLEGSKMANARFVYVKATQGLTFRDPRFASNWSRLGALAEGRKVHRGAYHFLSANQPGRDQALRFVAVLQAQGGLAPTDMPPVVDLEWDKACKDSPDRWIDTSDPGRGDKIIKELLDFMWVVEQATGRKPMVYTARSWWRSAIGSEAKFSRISGYPIWIADYSISSQAVEVPKVPNGAAYSLWQFTDRSQFGSKKLDANIFKGTEDEFYQRLQVSRF